MRQRGTTVYVHVNMRGYNSMKYLISDCRSCSEVAPSQGQLLRMSIIKLGNYHLFKDEVSLLSWRITIYPTSEEWARPMQFLRAATDFDRRLKLLTYFCRNRQISCQPKLHFARKSASSKSDKITHWNNKFGWTLLTQWNRKPCSMTRVNPGLLVNSVNS